MLENKRPFILPVLLFHSVSPDTPEYISVKPSFFERIIQFVASNYYPVSLETAYEQIEENSSPISNSIVVCFDDGYQDVFIHALPVLHKYKIPAAFFILPEYLGKNNLWNPKAEFIRQHLTITQVVELAEQGFQIGSHGLTHHKLTKFDETTIRKELSASRTLLEEIIQKPVPWFAFPYGSFNKDITHLTSAYYDLSFATEKGYPDWTQCSLGAIKRVNIYSSYSWAKTKRIIENSFL